MMSKATQDHMRDCLAKTTHVRVIYDPMTFELKQTIIPEHVDHLVPHQPGNFERHYDLPVGDYLKQVVDPETNLPNPKKLMEHVRARSMSS